MQSIEVDQHYARRSFTLPLRPNIPNTLQKFFSSSLFFISLLILTLLMPNTYAQGVQTESAAERTILGVLPSWAPLLAGAFAVGFGLAAIAYMLSAVFRLPELSVWAKSEIGEMVATGIIVAAVLIAVVFADGIFVAATGQTPMDASVSFCDRMIDTSLNIFEKSLKISKAIGIVSGIPPQYNVESSKASSEGDLLGDMKEDAKSGAAVPLLIITLSFFNVHYQKFYGVSPFLSYFGLVQTSIMSSTALSIVLSVALQFIKETALPVLIPLGVFLCCFAVTRKMGRTLIAFGIGLYFFFPASMMISQMMFNSAYSNNENSYIPPIEEPSLRFFGEAGSAIFAANYGRMFMTLLMLFPRILGPIPWPFVGICPGVAAPCGPFYIACYIGCFIGQFFVTWPITADIMEYFGLPIAYGIVDATWLSAGDVPGALLGQLPIPGVGNYAGYQAQAYADKYAAGALTDIVLSYTPYVLQYAIPAMLMPVVVFVVVITAIRAISPAIGGEVQILGVSELI